MPDRLTPDPVALAELVSRDGELAALRAENARLRAKCGEPEPVPTQIIEWWSTNGLGGSERHDEIEMPVSATDEEIEAEVRDAVMNFFEWSWARKEKPHA